ncbi:NADH-ubiquinone oxidoreductase chain N [Acetobacter malorum]|uniref:NADH-ubiquinone oxidoreductase chain N n=1 Tax=Acetobacter malorum TaxID=178901 RepID=A0A177GEE3_9PROT|nr:NADH-ubiquinone oxidoreductase chain N [Acetobacter malorum]
MSAASVNWTLALPEITLGLAGLVILVFGVLQREGKGIVSCTLLTVAAFVGCGVLVALSPDGIAYAGTFVNDGFARFMKILALLGGLVALVLTLSYRTEERHAATV